MSARKHDPENAMTWRPISIITLAAIVFFIYACGFVVVRQSHTHYAFDKEWEEREAYTFFDAWSRTDSALYVVYYPLLLADEKLCSRPFDRDKW